MIHENTTLKVDCKLTIAGLIYLCVTGCFVCFTNCFNTDLSCYIQLFVDMEFAKKQEKTSLVSFSVKVCEYVSSFTRFYSPMSIFISPVPVFFFRSVCFGFMLPKL